MVWLHRGGLYYGSGNGYLGVNSTYSGIVVTVSYRLGLLGFLNIPGSEIKGNYGMLDQVAALKWVQEKISSFGGIPSMVTLGQGVGASNVTYRMLSPLSTGLFQKAILQSGAATTPYTFFDSKDPGYGHDIVRRLGCNGEKLLACFRTKGVEDFLQVSQMTRRLLDLGHKYPVVNVDGELLSDEPLICLSKDLSIKCRSCLG